MLLHGVTGSGKTEVYLRAIAAALAHDRQALVLVPEIALTPQLVGRFRARFGGRESIAVLHSGLADGERHDAWRRIARGEARIVIGARSAVFAPLPRPGIIVVDEEHEGSYKQGEGFRYHARDLALLRGQMTGATVLLGSATPALTTYHRAKSGAIGFRELSARVNARPLPTVTLLDLRGKPPAGSLSPPLQQALAETLAAGEQALLLLNRRGFAPYLLCSECGATFRCPNCAITLTYHQGRRQLRCHYCDFMQAPPESCPGCGGIRIFPEGAGTERLAEELAAAFPEARLARMDRDTTARKGAHQQLLTAMLAGDIDLLVGTQMVAKGHDFPGVTLVGVVDADATLNFPDFRSAERTFALLTQVAGRAGRGDRPGRVLVQTRAPEHYALACAANHDYSAFYEQETAFRRALGYPPFGYLVNLVFAGNDSERTAAAADQLADALQVHAGDVELLGPAPCPLARLRGKSRVQLLLKASSRPPLQRLLQRLDPLRRTLPNGVALSVDVDPLDML
jgi:primosomal protein N' (replication factor Y)